MEVFEDFEDMAETKLYRLEEALQALKVQRAEDRQALLSLQRDVSAIENALNIA